MIHPHPQPTVFMETYGCQMNVLDSELVVGQLEALGYRVVSKPDQAGVVLINTCSVRELSEQKVWSQLGRIGMTKEMRRDMIVGVLGCMAEREGPAIIKRMPHVDLVCGPSHLDQLPTLIDNARHNRGAQLALAGHTSRRSVTLERATDGVESLDLSRSMSASDPNRFQAYVRVTRGCNKFCSFCVVPYTRGPEVHRSPEQILEEVRRLVDSGVREVTLIGQTVNHYTHTEGGKTTSFADLLALIHDGVPDLPRLRFITSYPRDFGNDALDVMAASPRICRYLHIPAQSGSDTVLQRMNRGYRVDAYLSLLERARARMPDICLAGDMIVGFPGETDADHEASVAFLKAARYKSCFVFKYSSRPGTVASRRFEDDIPEGVKKARNLELLAVQSDISLAQHRRHVGHTVEVLVEGHNKLRQKPALGPTGGDALVTLPRRAPDPSHARLVGRTQGDEIVAFDGPPEWVGQLVNVQVVNATPLTLLAQIPAPTGRPRPSTPEATP
jgi:tRNA-2-methylthio-N6-dimethylallyladenosine synthase